MFSVFDFSTFRLFPFVPSCLRAFVPLLLLLTLTTLVIAGGPRSEPPQPVSAIWDQPAGLLTIVFDRPLSVTAWPPLPIKGDVAVTAGAQHWSCALTVEIGGTIAEPNRHLLIAFGDPVAADPPADGATCAYVGNWLTGITSAPVAPFSGFPCDQP